MPNICRRSCLRRLLAFLTLDTNSSWLTQLTGNITFYSKNPMSGFTFMNHEHAYSQYPDCYFAHPKFPIAVRRQKGLGRSDYPLSPAGNPNQFAPHRHNTPPGGQLPPQCEWSSN